MKIYKLTAVVLPPILIFLFSVSGCRKETAVPKKQQPSQDGKPSQAVAQSLDGIEWAFKVDQAYQFPLSPDARYVASASIPRQYASQESVRVQEILEGKEVFSVKLPYDRGQIDPPKAESGFRVQRLVFSPNADLLAGVLRQESVDQRTFRHTEQDQIRIWHVTTGRELVVCNSGISVDHTHHITNDLRRDLVALSPDGRHFAWMNDQDSVQVWDMQTVKVIRRIEVPAKQIVFSPDGKRLAAVAGFVRVFDVGSGQEVLKLDGTEAVAYSLDGKLIAAYGVTQEIDSVRVWEAASGREKATLAFENRWSYCGPGVLSFSPDGKLLAANCGTKDYVGCVWDITTGKESRVLSRTRGPIFSLVFSRDGKRIYSANTTWQLNIPE